MCSMNKKIIKIFGFVVLFILGVLFGYFYKTLTSKCLESEKQMNSSLENKENINQDLALYYTNNGRTIYTYNINYIYYKEKTEVRLFENVFEKIDEIIEEEFKEQESKLDGISIFESNDMRIFKCENDNHDIYIGNKNFFYEKSFCKSQEKENFVQTFNILNVAEDLEGIYYFVTLRKYQSNEVFTAKIFRNLNINITTGKNYVFTFRFTDKEIETSPNSSEISLSSLFKNAELLNIEETDKEGLEQENTI